jgi:hypothetical protein
MRTVFVNPSRVRRRRRRSAPKRTRRRRRRNAGITSFVRNPSLIQNPRRRRRRNPMPSGMKILKGLGMFATGATAGALLNRVGVSHIPNFYLRNGARVLAAAGLAAFGGGSAMAAAAAGATLAPIVPEVEMQMAATTKNPQELAAELAGLLEADLSEDLEDDENLEGDEDLEDDLTDW